MLQRSQVWSYLQLLKKGKPIKLLSVEYELYEPYYVVCVFNKKDLTLSLFQQCTLLKAVTVLPELLNTTYAIFGPT